jgi:hypothetical protein
VHAGHSPVGCWEISLATEVSDGRELLDVLHQEGVRDVAFAVAYRAALDGMTRPAAPNDSRLGAFTSSVIILDRAAGARTNSRSPPHARHTPYSFAWRIPPIARVPSRARDKAMGTNHGRRRRAASWRVQ